MDVLKEIIRIPMNFLTAIYNILFYAVYGFVLLCSLIYEILRYAITGILLPFIIINDRVIHFRFNNKEKEKARLLREQQEEEFRIQREKRAEQERLAALQRQKARANEILEAAREERQLLHQTQNEDLYAKAPDRPKTFGDKLNDLLTRFNKKVKETLKKWHLTDSLSSTMERSKKNDKLLQQNSLILDFTGKDAVKSAVKILYKYEAMTAEGEYEKGYMEAYSKVEVHSFLLSEGMTVYKIDLATNTDRLLHSDELASHVRFKNKDLTFFLTQLSTYLKAGIPLVDALKILEKQYKNKGYKKIFRSMIYNLSMGDNFSTAMDKQGEAFPRLLINMVKTAEMTGELPEVLDDQEHYYTEMNRTRQAMKSALTYPLIVLVFAIGVMTFIMISVIPHFVSIFQSMDSANIPWITLQIMGLSSFLRNDGIYLALGIAAVIGLLIYLYKNVLVIRVSMQQTAMHMPVIGNLIIYNEVTIFTKTFASLLAHNVFITDSMEILSRVTNNEIYKMLIKDTIVNLAKGEKISTAFKDNWAFPQPAYEMIVTGEKTGDLPTMMAKVSDYYQELHQQQVNQVKTYLEPILIIFLTVIVGVIVLSIVIPMFSMYNSLENMG